MKKLIYLIIILLLLSPFAYRGAKKAYYNYLNYQAKQLEGSNVTNLVAYDINKKVYSFKDLKGKEIVIIFWASWCKTCIDEMPKIQKFYKNLNKDTILISALVDKKGEDARRVIKKYNINYPVIVNNTKNLEFFKYFKITHTPSIWIVDKNGTILAQNLLHIDSVLKVLK